MFSATIVCAGLWLTNHLATGCHSANSGQAKTPVKMSVCNSPSAGTQPMFWTLSLICAASLQPV